MTQVPIPPVANDDEFPVIGDVIDLTVYAVVDRAGQPNRESAASPWTLSIDRAEPIGRPRPGTRTPDPALAVLVPLGDWLVAA
jgi:hypothetical protein